MDVTEHLYNKLKTQDSKEPRPIFVQTLRIFISYPSDVQSECLYAERLIERLSNEYSASVILEAYFWEYKPMQCTQPINEIQQHGRPHRYLESNAQAAR